MTVAEKQAPIVELRIVYRNRNDATHRGYVNPGDVLTLEVGERAGLRMQAIPASGDPIYPRTRFEEIAGKDRVDVVNHDIAQGMADVVAVSTEHRNNPGATTLVSFELLDELNIRPGKTKGTITVEVVESGRRGAVNAPPQPVRPGNSPAAPPRGITLYEHQNYGGRNEKLFADDRELNDNFFRHDMASSIRVDPGCEAVLYEHTDFNGRSSVVREDVPDLGRSRVGNDSVSSIQVRCNGNSAAQTRGATLYEHQGYRGRSERLTADDRWLSDNSIGNDAVSSIRVDPGCEAVLYEHPDYTGRTSVVRQDIDDLRASQVGNDSVSSIEVRCPGR